MKTKYKKKNKALNSLFRQSSTIMDAYTHKQIGWLIIWLIVPLVVFITFIFSRSGAPAELYLVGLSVLLLLPFFYSLTVSVGINTIKLFYGIGLIKKEINLDNLESVHIVKNPWYYGYGIRLIPNGWLYNIHGPHAVELKFKDKKRVIRIGTDEPEELLKAIEQQRLL